MAKAAKETQETVYDRIEKLEDEIATLRNELDVIKSALRNKLARHEVKMIKKGNDVTSIIDN
jgi:cell division protein FtsB